MKKFIVVLSVLFALVLTSTSAMAEKDPETHVNEFSELGVTVGVWKGPHTHGVYGLLEGLYWWGPEYRDKVQNFGIGPILKLDSGASEYGAEWGHIAPGIQMGFWKNFSDEWYMLVKPRLTYRFEREGTRREDGLMPGGYVEVDRVLSPRDLLILAGDGWYFPSDSYAAARLYWEHQFSPKIKGKIGAGAVWHMLDETTVGFSPAVTVKYRNTWSFGVIADFSDGGPFYGAFVNYEFNSDRK